MPHRILQIIPTLDRAGAEQQMSLLAMGLPRDEFEVHVCVLTRSGPWHDALQEAGLPVTVIGKSRRFDPLAFWRLAQQIRYFQPDLVHTWIFAANSYGRAAARWCGVPHLVAGERCVDPWKRWHQLWIDRQLSRWTDRLVTNSHGTRKFYVERGLPADKFKVIPNGIPAPPAVTPALVRDELGIPSSANCVLTVGRLWPQKRIKDLVWAADLLKGVRDDIHLLVVGEGPQRPHLERFRDRVRVADRVHLLGHREDVPALLAASDVVWLASGYEGQSNALMEAMAMSKPVVATDIVGNRELVEDGVSGLLVPVGDAAAFAQKTQELLKHPERAQRLGRAARRRMLANFSVGAMVDAYAQLYRELLG